jgi:hypothetical protein
MRAERASFRPDNNVVYINGFRVRAKIEPVLTGNEKVEEVDVHEAAHAVVARRRGRRVRRVSVVKTSSYLGVTELDVADAVVAGASIANHNEGTFGDERAILASGRDFHSAVGEASSIVDANQKEIFAVAVRLRQKAEIREDEVDDAMASVNRVENQKAKMFIESPDGEKQEIDAQTDEKGNVVFMSEWVKAKRPQNEKELDIAA